MDPRSRSLTNLEWVIGLRMKVTTLIDETIEGTLYAYCPITNTVTLSSSAESTGAADYRILKVSFLTNIQVLETPTQSTNFTNAPGPELAPVNLQTIDARINKVITKKPSVPPGVGREGVEIFEALTKTLPCRWQGTAIVVLDEVMVESPYTAETCKSIEERGGGNGYSLKRVKMIVEGERRRLFGESERKGG
ncbi:hypothetical protein SAICODRAFT_73657 [Saitoella complicata NRRL Y-17804]|uniref:uncharacterized protein n=1 Tax=Saitoella complicata (strain BCRC 22490 / CBS 7301 / JCM 7358 / NBRC 10748 / NRRL Y-17804) TaxID=698492 RepID=UPI0008681726|nr:uncharacterized protein SAICODRAFT_73657 [Saitoella complicata NRRL Y-17804]ODQ50134.1 hypothetical protein SAICODRAFT_73657 [Saitoella complicata NRRL Y-17804]